MAVWWESLSVLQQVFAYFAIPATIILIVQTILVLFGIGDNDLDTGDGLDAFDADDFGDGGDGFEGAGDGLALFSIRGIVAFFSVGGWAGIVVAERINSAFISIVIAFIAGAVALYSVALLFKLAAGLQSKGNLALENAVGKTAKVYITIPGSRAGFGKVTLTFQGRFAECDAVTDEGDALHTGALVTVTGLADASTLIVAPLTDTAN